MDGAELRIELEKHHREGYGCALACCRRDKSEAENVLQAAYLKVLDGKARFDGRSSFKTWFFSVIRRTASDHRRRELLARLKLVDFDRKRSGDTKRTSFDEAYRSEIKAMFRRALCELPRRQREVLQLVFYHDLSIAEAADVMGVGVGSARTHYERGKKQLRRAMATAGIRDESEMGRQENQATVR